MQANRTVTINGRTYDAVTGLPIEKKKAAPAAARPITARPSSTTATAVHASTQRSQTLHRRAAKKPAPAKRPQPGRHMDIARSHKISRFASHPITKASQKEEVRDRAPQTHPLAAKALARTPAKSAPLTSKQIKETAIANALAKPAAKSKKERSNVWWRAPRFLITTACFLALIVTAYIVYISIPSISVSFAASQAGIGATYPEYKPDGYRLKQPVTFSDGSVVLQFASNSGPASYTVTQTRSSWDSSAVLDNVVRKTVGDNYETTQERGLTIYTYQGGASWVNGGILYTVDIDAPLSRDQIRRIATSL